jgi:hypothetical protein
MELERKLADLIFGNDPLRSLESQTDEAFRVVDRKQFALFCARLVARVSERLSDQFGGCLGLIEERYALSPALIAKEFIASTEYRAVREDVTQANETSPVRFEIAFLHFVLRTKVDDPSFISEFGRLFLVELSSSG